MIKRDGESGFAEIFGILPDSLKRAADNLSWKEKKRIEDIRLRSGRCVSFLFPEGEKSIDGAVVGAGDIEHILEQATKHSVYSAMESMKYGFITIEGGHRIGMCGNAVVKNGEVTGLTKISSLSIRIAREFPGFADTVLKQYEKAGGFQSTLIVAPPGCGKTTLLRDIIRQLSDGAGGVRHRVAVADERGEISAMSGGVAQLDVGGHTDVLYGCPKDRAALMLLKTMNPTIIAMDEITSPADTEAARQIANCGVSLLATCHGSGLSELEKRQTNLLKSGVFQYAVMISSDGRREITIERLAQ